MGAELLPAEIFETDDGPPFSDDDLAEYFEYVEDLSDVERVIPPRAEAAERWDVTDDGSAAWAMAKFAEAEAELEAVEQRHEFMLERIESWRIHNSKPIISRRSFFEARLVRYALTERERDDRRKTITTPSGKISTTRTAAKVVVEDEAAAIAWANTVAPDAVQTTQKLMLTPMRAAVEIVGEATVVDSNGEVVPGVAVQPARITATVKPEL